MWACVRVRARARAVCEFSESMIDVTDNAKNNFGDPLDAMYIACARQVSATKEFVRSKRQF